jgi:hypothetical protein
MVENCECSSFDEARQWFEKQWLQSPQLKGHYVGSEQLTEEQEDWLRRHNVERL